VVSRRSPSHQLGELCDKGCIIAMEGADHGGQKGFRIEALKIDGMSSVGSKESHERQLASPVAVPKAVNGIELTEELSGVS
jgi:hypothetical protein